MLSARWHYISTTIYRIFTNPSLLHSSWDVVVQCWNIQGRPSKVKVTKVKNWQFCFFFSFLVLYLRNYQTDFHKIKFSTFHLVSNWPTLWSSRSKVKGQGHRGKKLTIFLVLTAYKYCISTTIGLIFTKASLVHCSWCVVLQRSDHWGWRSKVKVTEVKNW